MLMNGRFCQSTSHFFVVEKLNESVIFQRYFNLFFFVNNEISHVRKRLTHLSVIYELKNIRYFVICHKYHTNIGHSLVEPGSVCEINECIFTT